MNPASGLRARFTAEGLDGSTWSNGPRVHYGAHEHPYDKVIAVEVGSIRFGLPGGVSIHLAAGDRLDLPAGTSHHAIVGPDGVTCLEAHLPSGSVAEAQTRLDGDW